jgi:hypothetical protein
MIRRWDRVGSLIENVLKLPNEDDSNLDFKFFAIFSNFLHIVAAFI